MVTGCQYESAIMKPSGPARAGPPGKEAPPMSTMPNLLHFNGLYFCRQYLLNSLMKAGPEEMTHAGGYPAGGTSSSLAGNEGKKSFKDMLAEAWDECV